MFYREIIAVFSGRKVSTPPGFNPRPVQPVASHNTEWAIPAIAHRTVWSYFLSIPEAARSKDLVCDRSLAGNVGSNPAGDMDVSVVCCQTEDSATSWSFLQSSHTECDLEPFTLIRPRPTGGCWSMDTTLLLWSQCAVILGVFKKRPNFSYKHFILQHFKHCPLQTSPLYWRYSVPNVSSTVGMLPVKHFLWWSAVLLSHFPESPCVKKITF